MQKLKLYDNSQAKLCKNIRLFSLNYNNYNKKNVQEILQNNQRVSVEDNINFLYFA